LLGGRGGGTERGGHVCNRGADFVNVRRGVAGGEDTRAE
jgi:hypothetical protein